MTILLLARKRLGAMLTGGTAAGTGTAAAAPRPGPVGGRIDKLEALRGLAAIYVVIHHTLPHQYFVAGWDVGKLNRLGQEAVILFFLISGFVIKYAFERASSKRFADYFRKRFYRIYLPLIIVLGLGYLARSHAAGQWIDPQLGVLLGNLLMFQDYVDVKPNVWVPTYLTNDPLWSLTYEWWFYMLFYPLTVWIRDSRTRNALVFSVSVLGAAVYFFLPHFPVRVFMYLGIWWSGVYLAERYLEGRLERLADIALPVAALGAASAVLALNVLDKLPELGPRSPGFYPWLELRHFVFAALAIVAGFVWRRLGWVLFYPLLRPFLWLAPMSYVVYISHDYLFTGAAYLDFIDNAALRWIAYFTAVVAISWVIECRLYPWLMRRLMPPKARSSTVAAPLDNAQTVRERPSR